jgi:hypothetical protein
MTWLFPGLFGLVCSSRNQNLALIRRLRCFIILFTGHEGQPASEAVVGPVLFSQLLQPYQSLPVPSEDCSFCDLSGLTKPRQYFLCVGAVDLIDSSLPSSTLPELLGACHDEF